ncbi:DUF86 domain-containing protein [Skermania sp. ID1734]|uniref:type VII toxin-antitoxin system HepT family RNase toxin n=1 Tax=Skermania sp. ID1734 TaxID=2597516 RepID=UPI0011802ACD|nr:DUF86 domain-containing protein [Skermania sp. ID1734]TSE01009.1 DUF86 domain-containing protein [Skermania sp. ID1734]
MVDLARIATLLQRIRIEREHLVRAGKRSDEELLTDPDALPAAKYRMIVCFESAIGAADHVIASEGLRTATSFVDSFRILGEAGVISLELSTTLQDAARFRNLLVHQFGDVDDHRVIEMVRTGLTSLDSFVQSLASYLSAR